MVYEIIDSFPNPVLPKIYQEPIFEYTQITTNLINANAISVPSMYGGVIMINQTTCLLGASWGALGCLLGASWVPLGGLLGAFWDPHGIDGYYLGTALDHYRCYQVYITQICGTKVVDTVYFP
jgi:hypothetical protein